MKINNTTEEILSKIPWTQQFDKALQEIICDLHQAESHERWSELTIKINGVEISIEDGNAILNVSFLKFFEYGRQYDWTFRFPIFLLNCSSEKYWEYMRDFQDEVERKEKEKLAKAEKEREERHFDRMVRNLLEVEEFFNNVENAKKLKEWRTKNKATV